MKNTNNMKYEVTYKGGKKKILERAELPKFSSTFNRMIKDLRIGENMYEVSEMVEIKRVE